MKQLTITTLISLLLSSAGAYAYEPYGTDLSLQLGGGISALSTFDANTLTRKYAPSLRNYDIQVQFFPTDHIGFFARHNLMSTPAEAESLYSNTSMTFGALYRLNRNDWSFRAGAGLGFSTPSDYSLISRGPEGAAPEFVLSGNTAPRSLALTAQIQASYNFTDVLYVFGNCSLFDFPSKYSVITRYFDSEETWSGAVRYMSGDIQSRDWQAKFCTNTLETISRAGFNPMISIGIGFTFNK